MAERKGPTAEDNFTPEMRAHAANIIDEEWKRFQAEKRGTQADLADLMFTTQPTISQVISSKGGKLGLPVLIGVHQYFANEGRPMTLDANAAACAVDAVYYVVTGRSLRADMGL